jgi:pimeloyl-ACP methyl ester carboxylesterase
MRRQGAPVKRRNPLLAAFLSLITLGLGQVYNGDLRGGVLLNVLACVAAFLYSFRIFTDGTKDFTFLAAFLSLFLFLKVYSIGQALLESRRLRTSFALRKFNRLYFYAAFSAFFLFLFIAPGEIVRQRALSDISAAHPFRSAAARDRYLRTYDLEAGKWPVPSETKTVGTSYGQTFVRISGPRGAPPLVLLHGASATSLMWRPNIKALAGSYRTYAVDNIYDLGRSIYTRKIRTPDDFSNWLDELFSALELGDRINLVGQSYGGWIAAQYALRFPGRLNKVVLLAPAGVLPFRREFLMRGLLSLIPHPYFSRSMMTWLLEDTAKKDQAGRELVNELVENIRLGQSCFKPKALVNPTVLTDEEWRSIRVPALFLVGENEKIYSALKAVERLREVAPRVEAQIIPEAGHDLTVAQADLVNSRIVAWLQ